MYVYVIFRVNEFDEDVFWAIHGTEESAKNWIEKHGTWSAFYYKKYPVNDMKGE